MVVVGVGVIYFFFIYLRGHTCLFEKTGRAGNVLENHKKMYPATHLVLNDPTLKLTDAKKSSFET